MSGTHQTKGEGLVNGIQPGTVFQELVDIGKFFSLFFQELVDMTKFFVHLNFHSSPTNPNKKQNKMNQIHQAQAKIESFKLQLWEAMELNQKEKMAATNAYLACREIGVEKVRKDENFNKNRGFQAGVMEFEFHQGVFAAL